MVACRQTSVTAFARQFHSAVGSLHVGNAFTDDQTHASRNLAMVQRYWIRHFFALRRHNDETLSAFGCATDTARTRHSLRFLSVRNVRHSRKPLATVQCRLAGRILAVLHLHRVPGYYRAVSVCAYDPSAARIKLEASGPLRHLVRRFGVVKPAVIHGEPTATMLGINFDEAVAEFDIAPGVILLRLNRRRKDRGIAEHNARHRARKAHENKAGHRSE